MLLTAHSTLLAVYYTGEEWIINAYAPGSHKLKLSRRIVLWGPFDHHPHSTQQAFHIYSRMNHTARLATPVHWAHCLNPSPFLGKGGHKAVSFCLFTSNSCIKDIPDGQARG